MDYNKEKEKSSINLSFCKTIKENQNFNTFEVFKMKVKDDNSSYGYLALANNESESIDIYKIYPKNDFKLIQSIKVIAKV